MQIFKSEYKFYGKHADYINQLKAHKFFSYNYEFLYIAPLYGLYRNRKGKPETTELLIKVPFEQIYAKRDKIELSYRLVLLGGVKPEDFESFSDRFFREVEPDPVHLASFEAYLFGGIEALFEELVASVPSNPLDKTQAIAQLIDELNTSNSCVDKNVILDLTKEVPSKPNLIDKTEIGS